MLKRLETTYKNRHIRIENHWFKGLTLIVDDEVAVHDNTIIHMDRDVPLIEYPLITKDGAETLRVYVDAIWNIKIAVTVNDELVATTHPSAVAA